MKELLKKFPSADFSTKIDYLIDTCFFIWIFERHKDKQFEKFLKKNRCAITSFNAEELIHVTREIHDKLKEAERRFFHQSSNLFLLNIPIHPGNKEKEKTYVISIITDFNCMEHDPSDAVLLATAIKINADILTRDKHDLFNAHLENCLKKYQIKILNTFPDTK
jgi:predicted nucleic acid-binding protein